MKIHTKLKNAVIVKLMNNGNTWELQQELKAVILNHYIKVPKLFVTDFASVPKYLKPLIPSKFIYNQVVVVHDYLYSTHEVDRETADQILREGLQYIDNYSMRSKIWSNIFYYAVRAFGQSHWDK